MKISEYTFRKVLIIWSNYLPIENYCYYTRTLAVSSLVVKTLGFGFKCFKTVSHGRKSYCWLYFWFLITFWKGAEGLRVCLGMWVCSHQRWSYSQSPDVKVQIGICRITRPRNVYHKGSNGIRGYVRRVRLQLNNVMRSCIF